tara:strand:+ start:233 stop:463 length:231 start_codon:yes stop_codon:yes gene_type:complete
MNFDSAIENLYNNPDSFAMAFDEAWNACDLDNDQDKKLEEKIQIVFEKINTHPFLRDNPIQAKQIALFRIKLLGLS